LDWAFRQVVPDVSHEMVLALVAKYRERYSDIGYAENNLYPGIADTLAEISSDGVQMGVYTSSGEISPSGFLVRKSPGRS
jgi:phosphoglycolate phosphatase